MEFLYPLSSLSRISIDPSDLIEPASSYPDGCESFSPVMWAPAED
jgi:hypothetical protein